MHLLGMTMPGNNLQTASDAVAQGAQLPDEAEISAFVRAFYVRVRADESIGPLFDRVISGRWDQHLTTMDTFWSSIVLGSKRYRGHVLSRHMMLAGIEGHHFDRWLELFIDTAQATFNKPIAAEFVRPALRIAKSLQLGMYGMSYEVPAGQRELLERYTGR
jgi:hemoglobin